MSVGSRQQQRRDGRPAQGLDDDLQARGVSTWETDFIASIDAGVADANADDVMDTDALKRWLAARRQVATPEQPR